MRVDLYSNRWCYFTPEIIEIFVKICFKSKLFIYFLYKSYHLKNLFTSYKSLKYTSPDSIQFLK